MRGSPHSRSRPFRSVFIRRLHVPFLVLACGACNPAPPASFLPTDALGPLVLILSASGDVLAGGQVRLTVTLPAPVSGKQTYFPVSSSGVLVDGGPCPGLLNGGCVDLLVPLELHGPVESVEGISTYLLDIPDPAPDTLCAQGIVVHNGQGFETNTLELEVVEVVSDR
jgi:hypothetical protein